MAFYDVAKTFGLGPAWVMTGDIPDELLPPRSKLLEPGFMKILDPLMLISAPELRARVMTVPFTVIVVLFAPSVITAPSGPLMSEALRLRFALVLNAVLLTG